MTQDLTIYGEKKGGGHTPIEANDTLDSKQTVRLLFALSEGEIQGVDDILLNGASISNYSTTVSYEVRTGTVDQTVIGGFSDVEAPVQGAGTFPVSLLKDIQHVYSFVASFDAVRLTFTLPRLEKVTDLGDRVGYTVSMNVYRRTHIYGSAPGSWQLVSAITKDGKCTNPYSFDIRVAKPTGLASVDSWDIMVVRASADDSSDKFMSTTLLSAITTITEKTLTYPKTALVGVTLKDASVFSGGIPVVKFKVKGMKIPLPTNYNATAHTYSEATPWDGSFKTYNEYTNNLGWITYWLLRDSNWGLGISAADVDLGSFYSYAKYCDGLVSDGFGGTEFRYTINAQFIQRDNVPTFLTYLLNLGNANFATNSLGQISIIYDHAGQAVTKVVSNANVIDGVFDYTSNDLESRTNLVNVTYAKDSLFGDSDTATVYDQTLINRYGLQTSDVILFGCTSEAQAIRKARWALYTNCKTTDIITFKQLFYGASYTVGELISIMDSDNVIANAKHAVIIGSSITSGTTTITLDRAINLGNYSYTVQFIAADGLTFISKTITQLNGNFSSITYTGTEVPYIGASILFSSTALQPRIFKVTRIDKASDGVYTITGLIHDENKYTYIESVGSLPVPSSSGNFVNYADFSIPAVTNITVQQVYATNGVIDLNKLNVKWDWSDTGATYRPNFIVSYRRDNQTAVIVNNLTTTSFDIEYPLPGVYDIFVWASNPFSGIKSAVTEYIYNYRVAAATSSLNPPTSVVVSGTAGVAFSGKDCVLTWGNNVLNDSSVDKLNDYVVQVLTSAAVLKGTFTVPYDTNKGGTFNLTYDMNVGLFGTATRSFKVRVFSRDLIGDLSNYIEVSPTNPAPVVTSFSVSNVINAAYLKATIPTDPDVVSYTFKKYDTDVAGNLLATITSVSNYVDFEAPSGTPFWYTVTANDVYGAGEPTTRISGTAIGVDSDTYTYTGLNFKPNDPSTNSVSWTAFTATKNGTTSVNVLAGNVAWTTGILYLYYIPGNTTLQSNTSLTTAIAAGGRILATYKGGTDLTADAGRAFTSGDMILAGTVGSNALVTNTAVITNMAQIGNILQSDNYSANTGNNGIYSGWRLDKTGTVFAAGITIVKSNGEPILSAGSGVNWAAMYGAGKPADNATKNTIYNQTTAPTGGTYTTGDLWVDTDAVPTTISQWQGTSWVIVSTYTNNTNQLTDGAGLGTTATWSGVSGAGKPADNATVGATWGTNITSQPTSLSGINSTEGTKLSGIATGANNTYVDGSGNIQGVSSGAGTAVQNSLLNGAIATAGTTATWSGVSGTGKPADNATVNNVTYSSTAPTSPVNGDIWVDTSTSPYTAKVRVSSAWQTASNLTTNTNQLTDGANLGGTATWAGVSGTGKPADNATVGATFGVNIGGQITDTNSITYIGAGAIKAAQIGSIALVGTSNFSVKTATSGNRMEMDSQVIKVFDSAGVVRVKLGNLAV